ncbi:indolepyruvate ferredoxin oxidoreductase subunit alpha, partial [Chloroflexota bacterium]
VFRVAQDIYERLARHLSNLELGLTYIEELVDILRENFTPTEAEVALALPTNVMPLQTTGVDDIIDKVNLSRKELVSILEGLAERGLLYSGSTNEGEKGYALLQKGFGFPQTFQWKGERTPYAKKMAEMVSNYNRRKANVEIHKSVETKHARYIPVNKTIELTKQGVYDFDMMENVVERARVIAVAHCPCRMKEDLQGKGCGHLIEVCLKFDDLAEYIIERGFGREITKEEALELIRKSEEDGLVHFVDNAQGDIKHNCNCCGCCCWNVGPIRRRKIPRDMIMATYFISEVDEEECNGCGDCVEICPVNVITIEDNLAVVDKDWCIGCGLCTNLCAPEAIRLVRRSDVVPPTSFKKLHETVLREKNVT